MIIPSDQLRFYDPVRHAGRYHAVGCSQTLIVYPMPSGRGWRQLTKFQDWRRLSIDEFTLVRLPPCRDD